MMKKFILVLSSFIVILFVFTIYSFKEDLYYLDGSRVYLQFDEDISYSSNVVDYLSSFAGFSVEPKANYGLNVVSYSPLIVAIDFPDVPGSVYRLKFNKYSEFFPDKSLFKVYTKKKVSKVFNIVVNRIRIVDVDKPSKGVNEPFVLRFNHSVDLKKVKESISVRKFLFPVSFRVSYFSNGNEVLSNVVCIFIDNSSKGDRYDLYFRDFYTKEDTNFTLKFTEDFKYLGLDVNVDKRYGDVSFVLNFNNPIDRSMNLSEFLKIDPIPEDLYFEVSSNKIFVFGGFSGKKKYKISISSNIRDVYFQTLGDNLDDYGEVDEIYSYFAAPSGFMVMESYLPLILSMKVRNINSIYFEGYFIKDLKSISDLFFGNREFSSNDYVSYKVNLRRFNISEGEFYNYRLNLRKVIGQQKSGVLVYSVRGDPEYYPWNKEYLKRGGVILITDIGLTVKTSPFRVFVMVRNIKDNIPVKDAIVYGCNKNGIFELGKTDVNGVLFTKVTNNYSFFIAKKGDSIAVDISLSDPEGGSWTDYEFLEDVYFNNDFSLGRSIIYSEGSISSRFNLFLFTDKYLYKPSETVNFKGFVKERRLSVLENPKGEVSVYINDSRGEEVTNFKVGIDEYGGIDFSLKLDKNVPTGYYYVRAYFKNCSEKISFRVEDFKPAIAEINIIPEKNFYSWEETFSCSIVAKYLFGAFVKNPINVQIDISPYNFKSRKYMDYEFGYYSRSYSDYPYSLFSSTISPSENGRVYLKVPIKKNIKSDGILTVKATTTLEDKSTVSETRRDIFIIRKFYVGAKLDKRIYNKNDNLKLNLVAVNHNDDLYEGDVSVKVKVIRDYWYSYQVVGVNGRVLWRWDRKTENVREDVISFKGITNIDYSFTKGGDYSIEISYSVDKEEFKSKLSFVVTAEGFVGGEVNDDRTLSIRLDKNYYKIGQKANLLIPNPFNRATAVISIEGEDIYEVRVFEMFDSFTNLYIPILEEYSPNVFVSVLLLSPRRGEEQVYNDLDWAKPSYLIGYEKIKVDTSPFRLKVNIEVDREKYMPGDTVNCSLFVSNYKKLPVDGEVVVSVVDEGVLRLVNYKLPDPSGKFYSRRGLYVYTSDTRRDVYGQRYLTEKGEVIGGDGDEEVSEYEENKKQTGFSSPSEKSARTDVRRDFRDSAFYTTKLKVVAGKANFSFKLPDNLTTFRIMVLAYTKDSRFGYGESKIVVNKPLMLISSFPRFVRSGDEVWGSLVVHNYSGTSGTVKITLEPKGPFDFETTSTNVEMKNNSSKEVLFKFRVNKLPPGKYEDYYVIAKAKIENLSDSLKIELPVYNLDHRYSTFALRGRLEDSEAEKVFNIDLSDALDFSFVKLKYALSSSAFAELTGALDYLIHYPYGCLEQKSSQMMPLILGEDFIIKRKMLKEKTKDDLRKTVQSFIDEVPKYWVRGKGFDYWPNSQYASPYITVYAMFFLSQARDKGYKVDEKMFREVLEILKGIAANSISKYYPGVDYMESFYSPKYVELVRSFAFYVLALNNYFDEKEFMNFYSSLSKKDAEVTVLSFLLKTSAKSGFKDKEKIVREITNILLSRIVKQGNYAYYTTSNWKGFYYDDLISTSLVLQALLEAGIKVDTDIKMINWIIDKKRVDGHWGNTHDNAMVMWALSTYLNVYEKLKPNYIAKVFANLKEVVQSTFNSEFDPVIKGEDVVSQKFVSLSEITKSKSFELKVQKSGQGSLYYNIFYSYLSSRPVTLQNNFIISKRYIDYDSGKEVKDYNFVRGKRYIVEIYVSTKSDHNFVIVDDSLPSGFEPVILDFATESNDKQIKEGGNGFYYVEKYKDRVIAFAKTLYKGNYTIRYVVRAVSKGRFESTSTIVGEMYNPDIIDYYSYQNITISDLN